VVVRAMIMVMLMLVTVIMGMVVCVVMRLVAMFVVTMFVVVMNRLVGVGFVRGRAVFAALIGLGGLRGIDCGVLDDIALDPFALAAAAGVAVARTAAVTVGGAVLALFLGLAMGAFVSLDQRLTVGDRDLVIVGMDFAEGEEAVAVAAIFDEGRLQRRLYARDLGEVDIAAQLLALGGLEIKFFDAIAADHNDPGLFRMGGIDQHLVGHFGALDGGGRGAGRARNARPGDATVHLIRG
jgi:hypothetical protein